MITQDPIQYFAQLCRRYSINLDGFVHGKNISRNSLSEAMNGQSELCFYEFPPKYGVESSGLALERDLSISFWMDGKLPTHLRGRMVNFAYGDKYKNGGLPSFNLNHDDLSFFHNFKPHMCFDVFYSETSRQDKDIINESTYHFEVFNDRGNYDLEFVNTPSQEMPCLEDKFRDLDRIGAKDYRPYMQRVLELYSGSCNLGLDRVIDHSIGMIFTGQEKLEIEQRVKNYRLTARNDFASVPRMNLGIIKLPAPGNHKEERSFMIDSAPFLVEYVSAIGLMPRDQAEATVAQQLVNRLVHNSDFQLSRKNALEVLAGLSGTREVLEGVA